MNVCRGLKVNQDLNFTHYVAASQLNRSAGQPLEDFHWETVTVSWSFCHPWKWPSKGLKGLKDVRDFLHYQQICKEHMIWGPKLHWKPPQYSDADFTFQWGHVISLQACHYETNKSAAVGLVCRIYSIRKVRPVCKLLNGLYSDNILAHWSKIGWYDESCLDLKLQDLWICIRLEFYQPQKFPVSPVKATD